jgi:hypothetical protein
VRAWDLNATN